MDHEMQHQTNDDTSGSTLLELGLDTFGDVTVDAGGRRVERRTGDPRRRGGGRARRCGSVSTSSASASTTATTSLCRRPRRCWPRSPAAPEQIRLGSAVTVLSSDDPVRVFQRFATLDAVSNGRAEVILGRGSFIESFPLFGYELGDYEQLFEEKLDLFAQLLHEQPVTWSGATRAADRRAAGVPAHRLGRARHLGRRRRQPAVGGARRPPRPAADGRDHRRREPPVPAVRRPVPPGPRASSVTRRCRWACTRPVTSPRPTRLARDQLFPHMKLMRDRIGAERGWGPMSRAEYDHSAGPSGALYVGSPETVARKIAATARTLGLAAST